MTGDFTIAPGPVCRVERTPNGAVSVVIVRPPEDGEPRLIAVTLPAENARRLAVHLLECAGEPT